MSHLGDGAEKWLRTILVINLDHHTSKLAKVLPGSGRLVMNVSDTIADVLVVLISASNRLQLLGILVRIQASPLSCVHGTTSCSEFLRHPEHRIGDIDVQSDTSAWTTLAEAHGAVDTFLGFDVAGCALQIGGVLVLLWEPGALDLVHLDGWCPVTSQFLPFHITAILEG